MPVGLAGKYVAIARMVDDVLQHIAIAEEFMLVDKWLDHEMNIVVQTAPVIQQRFDGNSGVGEAGEVFGYGVMDVEFSILPELERAHGGEGLGDRSQMKSRMRGDGVPMMQRIGKTFVFLVEDDAVLGDQDTAVESTSEHR